MVRAPSIILLSGILAAVFALHPIAALTFNLNFISGATNPNDPGNAKLRSIVTAAGDLWGELIEDAYTMTVNVAYYTNDSSGNNPCDSTTALACAVVGSTAGGGFRTATGNIYFSRDKDWYWDSTPYDNDEFNFSQTLYRDLSSTDKTAGFGGASPQSLLEIGYRGSDNSRDPNVAGNYDMLSTALHEFGHLLGIHPGIPAANFETSDGDYDIAPAFINGAQMSIKATPSPEYDHLVNGFLLMKGDGATRGVRRLPSAADIFAMASVGRWSQINLQRIDYLSTTNTSWVTGTNWEGYRIPGSGDFVAVRHGGTARISGGASVVVGEVLVDNNSNVTVADGLLLTDVLRLTSTGRLNLTGGEVRVRNDLFEDTSGTLVVAGASAPTFSLIDGAFGTTGGIALGGFANPAPGVFLPAPGNLRIESGARMDVTGNAILGLPGPIVGPGNVTVDNAQLFVGGVIQLAPQASAQLSELNIRNNAWVTAGTVQAVTPTSRVRLSSGKLRVTNLSLPAPGILLHSGGELQVDGGAYQRLDERISGTGNPLLRLTNGATSTSLGLALGGFSQPVPGVFLTETGELHVESNSMLTTTGNVVLGGVGPNAGHGIARVENGTWKVSGGISLAPGPTTTFSRLTISGSSTLTADTIQAVTPYSKIDFLGGNVTTKNLVVPTPGIVGHKGGTVVINGGAFSNPGTIISGNGSPILRLTNGAVGTTGDVQLGGFLQGAPGLFLPESGELRIESSSTLNTSGNVLLGANGIVSGPGRAVLDDGVWNVSGDVVFAATPTQELSQLTIRNNSQLTARTVQAYLPSSRIHLIDGGLIADHLLAPAAQFEFTGGLLNVDAFTGPLIQGGGRVMIGDSPGEMQVNGSYLQNGGVLEIELLGATSAGSDYDLLSITGTAGLGGALEVSLLAEFEPEPGNRFTFLTASGGVSGAFSSVTLPSLPSDLNWRLQYNSNSVVLEVFDVAAGDFDNDGDVDGRDFLVWQRNPSVGDLADWQANYGVGSLFATVTVPEPASFLSTVLMAMAPSMRCPRRRHRSVP